MIFLDGQDGRHEIGLLAERSFILRAAIGSPGSKDGSLVSRLLSERTEVRSCPPWQDGQAWTPAKRKADHSPRMARIGLFYFPVQRCDGMIQRNACITRNTANNGRIPHASHGCQVAKMSTTTVSQIRLQPTSVMVPLKLASSVAS